MQFPEPPCGPALPIPASRLKWLLQVIGWSRHELARRLGIAEGTAARWVQGRAFTPNRVAVWLETLAAVHSSMPLPFMWVAAVNVGGTRHPVGGVDDQTQMVEAAWDDPLAPRRDIDTSRTTTDLETARARLHENGGWLLDLGDGKYLVTAEEDIVRELRGEAFLAECEKRECWDETASAQAA